jgi:hypothetical protein
LEIIEHSPMNGFMAPLYASEATTYSLTNYCVYNFYKGKNLPKKKKKKRTMTEKSNFKEASQVPFYIK